MKKHELEALGEGLLKAIAHDLGYAPYQLRKTGGGYALDRYDDHGKLRVTAERFGDIHVIYHFIAGMWSLHLIYREKQS